MENIALTYDGDVAILLMQNGENRHNPAYAQDMLKSLQRVIENTSCKALVITSNDEKCFSK